MLNDRMEEALNGQLNAELYSAYLYLSMSAYFSSVNLPGFANWMRIQRLEEISHGMKFYDYILSSEGRVRLTAIEAPPTEWESPLDTFEAVYRHEQKVTGLIHDLVDLAIEEKDNATERFLDWFVDEQVEEEESADEVVQGIKRVADATGDIFMMDRELAQRAFHPQPSGIEGGLG